MLEEGLCQVRDGLLLSNNPIIGKHCLTSGLIYHALFLLSPICCRICHVKYPSVLEIDCWVGDYDAGVYYVYCYLAPYSSVPGYGT